MRRTLVPLTTIAAIVLVTASAGVTTSAYAVTQPSEPKSFLFTVEATSGHTAPMQGTGSAKETFRLTLTGVDPVTIFTDRPFRDAKLISPRALDANWNAWFVGDPPNAVLTFSRPGRSPGSIVVTLTNPRYEARDRSLTFTAMRDRREHDPLEKGANWQRLATPSIFSGASLFIDEVGEAEMKAGDFSSPFFAGSVQCDDC